LFSIKKGGPLKSKTLLVHAYAIARQQNGSEIPDPFMTATIMHVVKCHQHYEQIILLGGWHNKELGENRLLSDYAREQLIAQGVRASKISNMKDFDFGFNHMPPRSTEEEIILAKSIIGILPDDAEYAACFISCFAPTATWYYEKLGIMLSGLELVDASLPPERNLELSKVCLGKLEGLQTDPGLTSEKTVVHLTSRTLGEGYIRPNPADFFVYQRV
jgi:hypothetical protein